MSRSGDAAFREFFAAEYPAAVRRARLIVGDAAAAEDVAAETFARLYARWRKVLQYDQPAAWVRLVATRLAIRAAGKNQTIDAPDRGGIQDERSNVDVEHAIRGLPARQRAAVLLYYFDDLPVEEVASEMGCRPGTAKAHLHRARAALRLALGEETSDAVR